MRPPLSGSTLVRTSVFAHAVATAAAALAMSGPFAGTTGPPMPSPPAAASTHPSRIDLADQARVDHCTTASTSSATAKQVWLTFDDGGSAKQVNRILAVLKKKHVQAMFFPIGTWAAAHPDLVARIGAQGHLIGDHTQDHADLANSSDGKAAEQIAGGELPDAAGWVPLLRPPYGAGAYTRRLNDLAASEGLSLCTWTVDTRDWAGASSKTIVKRVRHGDATTPPVRAGGVVIMHMNGDHTGKALPGVIRAVRARGLSLHSLH